MKKAYQLLLSAIISLLLIMIACLIDYFFINNIDVIGRIFFSNKYVVVYLGKVRASNKIYPWAIAFSGFLICFLILYFKKKMKKLFFYICLVLFFIIFLCVFFLFIQCEDKFVLLLIKNILEVFHE